MPPHKYEYFNLACFSSSVSICSGRGPKCDPQARSRPLPSRIIIMRTEEDRMDVEESQLLPLHLLALPCCRDALPAERV